MTRPRTGRIKCEGCDGFGVRVDSTPHAGKKRAKVFVIEDQLGGGEICKIGGRTELGFPWYRLYTGPLLFETEEIANQFMKENRHTLEKLVPVSRLKVVSL